MVTRLDSSLETSLNRTKERALKTLDDAIFDGVVDKSIASTKKYRTEEAAKKLKPVLQVVKLLVKLVKLVIAFHQEV
jgi:hypothetical protein